MSNQLVVPYKRTTIPPIKAAVREYLAAHDPDTHPDAFEWDMSQWESLRADVSNINLHVSAIDDFLKYHAHLVLLLSKFAVDFGLVVSYNNAFQPNSPPVSLQNLSYERLCVLFNLAALLSHLADNEDRSNVEGIKRATAYYQNAAGALAYLMDVAHPPYLASLTGPAPAPDLSHSVLKSLQSIMLAQAQECYWQKAVIDNYRNGTIARLAKQVSLFYGAALEAIQSDAAASRVFPASWTPHLRVKQHHFEAASQLRKSMDDSENARYGLELARLSSALRFARRGLESSHRGVSETVIQDIATLAQYIEDRTVTLNRDNDLIYHQEIPPLSSLDPVEPASLVQSAVLGGLKAPNTALSNNEQGLFGDLLNWGAREAIGIYAERRTNVISEIQEAAEALDLSLERKLQELNLPTALDLLDRPLAPPPTLLGKAREVRTDNGPRRIKEMIEDVQRLAGHARILLNESFDMLDLELEQDEGHRKTYGALWSRPPSNDVNGDLVANAQSYQDILAQGETADATVRSTWAEWEDRIETLALDEDALLNVIPGSSPSGGRSGLSSHSTQTQSHARVLRGYLEELEALRRTRRQALNRVRHLASSDDITPRIKRVAGSLERWTDIRPAQFEDVIAEELGKYERFRGEVVGSEDKQGDLLASIEERNKMLLQAKREDPNTRQREKMIRDLDVAHSKYLEIIKNLKEGLGFYNDVSIRLMAINESCAKWTNSRHQELSSLVQDLSALSLETTQGGQNPPRRSTAETEEVPSLSPPHSSPYSTPSSPPPSSPPSRGSKRDRIAPRNALGNTAQPGPTIAELPPPDSGQWEPLPIMGSQNPTTGPSLPPVSTSPNAGRPGLPKGKGKQSPTAASGPAANGNGPSEQQPAKPHKAKKASIDRQVF